MKLALIIIMLVLAFYAFQWVQSYIDSYTDAYGAYNSLAEGAEICLSEQDAGRLILEYERGQICKAEVSEWEQYSVHKEQEIAVKDKIIDAYKWQIEADKGTIESLRSLALKPEPKFKILLSPALYAEMRAIGTLSSDLIRGGVKLDILRAWGLTFYGKAEGSYRDDTRSTGFGVYAGAEWRPW